MTARLGLLWLALWATLAGAAAAHEVRPALIDIRQSAPSAYDIVWKQPMMGDLGIHLAPHMSNGWLERPPRDHYAAGSFLIERWRVADAKPRALAGVRLSVEGLRGAMTDVFVRARLEDGRAVQGVLRGDAPDFRFAADGAASGGPWRFLALGVEHILSGPDHLLFVLGLLMIVPGGWPLVRTISGFTLAHSLTLGLATFWRLALPVALLNMLVATSILFLALELMRARRGGTSLTLRFPLVPAFAFGLLHGLGFAAGLAALDLPRPELLGALLQFNLGVEIAQLGFVALVLLLLRAFRLMEITWPRPLALTPTYVIGVAGATWMFQFAAAALEGG